MSNSDKLTLAEIRAAVKGKLDDANYSNTLIDEAANDFQNELFTSHRIRFMETSDTLTLSEGETSLDFPEDFLTMLEMTLIYTASQYNNLKRHYINYEEFMRDHANFSVASAQRPQNWTEFGSGVRFTNPSDATYTINLDYLRLPELMESDSDEAEVRKVWKELYTQGTLARAMELNEDYAEAAQEREKLDPLIVNFVAREGRGNFKTGPTVITKGNSRRAYRADRDFR